MSATGAEQASASLDARASVAVENKINTTLAAAIVLRARAGSSEAQLELAALSDLSGSRSTAKIRADQFLIGDEFSVDANGNLVARTIKAEHIDADVRNVDILYQNSTGTAVIRSSTSEIDLITPLRLNDYDTIEFVTRSLKGTHYAYGIGAITRSSILVTVGANEVPICRIFDTLFTVLRNSSNTTLRLKIFAQNQNLNPDESITIHAVVGIKNPRGSSPDPTSTTTTNRDEIFRLATTTPSAPSGGGSSALHTPTGWSRTQPSPTTTQSVYRATRTRSYLNGVFQSATSWGSVTRVAAALRLTTDTDEIWRRSSSTPSTPTGGTSSQTHTPSGWTRSQPSSTTTQGVYRATRVRSYVNGVFSSATAWGSVTRVSAPIAVTTDTDEIWRRSSSTPSTPTGGTSSETHTPSGWTRTKPSATITQAVYKATRTRTYHNRVFSICHGLG